MEQKKFKLKKSQRFTKFYQFLYLTVSNFTKNNLWESSSSCSFGFIFSFVPIALIILTILIGVLKVSPAVLNYAMIFSEQVEEVFDLKPIINNLVNLKSIRFVDIFLALWVIWMARRLFLSIVQAMNRIFHSIRQRKGLLNQLLTFFSEFVLVFIFVTITLSSFTFSKLLDNSFFAFFRETFPALFKDSSNLLFTSIPYFLLFAFTLYVFRIVSGTKPKYWTCFFYAALSTGGFYLFSYFVNKFMNMSNYNVVYGTISTLIILMFKVYFFFVIFLFCAQMVYVSQFFDSLLLAELYLLPSKTQTGFTNTMRRRTFINSTVLQSEKNTRFIKTGEVIYSKGDLATSVYYLRKGDVWEQNEKGSVYYKKGSFFGELPILLNQPRNGTATALTNCEILYIDAADFLELAKNNPSVSVQALEQVNSYTKK